jgi:16S rRNA (adenine1518-N6/adenine1519-N6)-dimethyltransferase
MKLSAMREVLQARGIQLTKSLGQNFLHDTNQLQRIVKAAELTSVDKVLEIGPGLGPLTDLLLEQAGEVLAIEKDARVVEVLRERFPPGRSADLQAGALVLPPERGDVASQRAALQLLHDDALEFIRRERRDWSDWKLVANLPYSVASPILVELAQSSKRPERMVVTLQLEVARRLMAGADDDDYGVLSLLVQLAYEPRDWFNIPATCFFPMPDVDSACVTLVRRGQPLLLDDQHATFVKIVKRGFSQRRKMMMKLLKADWPLEKLEKSFAELNIPPQTRAEKVSLELFARLAALLDARSSQT